jgi:hypothetical protein
MTNLINNLIGWSTLIASELLIGCIGIKCFNKGMKIGTVILVFFAGCIGLYFMSNPEKMQEIGGRIINTIMEA